MVLVLKAANAAARWDVHQRRKDPARGALYQPGGGRHAGRRPLVIAALLHDAIKDCVRQGQCQRAIAWPSGESGGSSISSVRTPFGSVRLAWSIFVVLLSVTF
jgi:hypothetical protein